MKIIKPYGTTTVEQETDKKLTLRQIQPKQKRAVVNDNPSYDLYDFYSPISQGKGYKQNVLAIDSLITAHIAIWISVIDKIYKKPQEKDISNKKSLHMILLQNSDVYKKRDALGKECFKLLKEHLKNLGISIDDTYSEKWNVKIHPYDVSSGKTLYIKKKFNAKGRWYNALSGETACHTAQKIKTHIYENAFNIQGQKIEKGKGIFEHRLASIEHAIAPLSLEHPNNDLYKPKLNDSRAQLIDLEKYKYAVEGCEAPDIVKKIFEAYEKKYNEYCDFKKSPKGKKKGNDKSEYGHLDTAMDLLREHYVCIFGEKAWKKVKEDQPEALEIHMALKAYYKKLLKRGDSRLCNLVKRLPRNMHEMQKKLGAMRDNHDVNHYIRLGKIIHYTLQGDWEKWENNQLSERFINHSFYRTSKGQHEIKQSEAFVKIWLTCLSNAARTLNSWIDPDDDLFKDNTDIIGRGDDKIWGKFEQVQKDKIIENYPQKLEFLFGNEKEVFLFAEDRLAQEDLIRFTLNFLAQIRHASFHFKGLEKFSKEIQAQTAQNIDYKNLPLVTKALEDFYLKDQESASQNIRNILQGLAAHFYLTQTEVKSILEKLCNTQDAVLHLPKFSKMLQRIENVKDFKDLHLPDAPNRNDLEHYENLRLQYALLKMIYEKPFRVWLETHTDWKLYAEKAIERAQKAAQGMNGEHVIAKSAQLNYQRANSLSDLFYDLSHQTAKDMQIQKGYESDGGQAKKQAGYIEDFKCDIIGQAFSAYLKEEGLGFLQGKDWRIDRNSHDPSNDKRKEQFNINQLLLPAFSGEIGEDWQAYLYYLLHLIPIEDINLLLHQMRKWLVVTEKSQRDDRSGENDICKKFLKVMTLYSDMHDAKFIDNNNIDIHSHFEQCYENKALMEKIFPKADIKRTDALIPQRGLREILRYGDMKNLQPVLSKYKATSSMLEQWQDLDKEIVEEQKQREDLHKRWVKEPKKLSEKDKDDYKKSVEFISKHKELTKSLYLVDHKNLHRLMMRILGRFIGFSHHYERDVYFVVLAEMFESGKSCKEIFEGKRKIFKFLKKGQINEVTKKMEWRYIKRLFGEYIWETRKNFAHFNMLQGKPDQPLFPLTNWINNARGMMKYDRKMKNSVAKAILGILDQEGFQAIWKADDEHKLYSPVMQSKQICHLGGKDIIENMHSEHYLKMVQDIL